MMENDREVDKVLMNIKNASGGILSASLFSARITLELMVYLMRLAKKGLVASGIAGQFKSFMEVTGGDYTIYNIPLPMGKAEKLRCLNQLELKLQETRNPLEKLPIRNEIKELQKQIPELGQLKSLGMEHCVLPKLDGSQTIQVAVGRKSDQIFKSWFLNHLTASLSGGEKFMEDLKAFTEGNYTILNIPLEGEGLAMALSDFRTLEVNYSVLPDLNVGDGYSQIAIPNADRNRLEAWFSMWKQKQLQDGKEPGEMYAISQESYMDMGAIGEKEYVEESGPEYQQANAEYEAQSKKAPWTPSIQKENSPEYARLLQDDNYEKITINADTLVDSFQPSTRAKEMRKNGYFTSRIPGTYGEKEKTLILPTSQVFSTDNGKTYLAFLPKNSKTMVMDPSGTISEIGFPSVYGFYDSVNRGFRKVQDLQRGILPEKAQNPPALPKNTPPKITPPKP